jgi:8-oxo-dGTP diphosphatase
VTNDIFEKESKHYITIALLADHASGEPKIMEPEKCTDMGWFSWNNLPRPLFLPLQNAVKQANDPTKLSGCK